MIKKIVIESKSVPDDLGYNDVLMLEDESTSMTMLRCPCSTCPNPTKQQSGEDWREAYAWISPGTYYYECWISPKHGKCLKINDLGAVETRNPNRNHDNLNVAYSVEVHEGYTETWRGSAACVTLPPAVWGIFIAYFNVGDKGQLIILDSMMDDITV